LVTLSASSSPHCRLAGSFRLVADLYHLLGYSPYSGRGLKLREDPHITEQQARSIGELALSASVVALGYAGGVPSLNSFISWSRKSGVSSK